MKNSAKGKGKQQHPATTPRQRRSSLIASSDQDVMPELDRALENLTPEQHLRLVEFLMSSKKSERVLEQSKQSPPTSPKSPTTKQ